MYLYHPYALLAISKRVELLHISHVFGAGSDALSRSTGTYMGTNSSSLVDSHDENLMYFGTIAKSGLESKLDLS